MPIQLDHLPAELLVAIAAAAEEVAYDMSALRALRCVSKNLSRASTHRLFRTVKVLSTDQSTERYTKILEHPELKAAVAKVIFQTREDPDEEEDGGGGGEEPLESFLQALEDVGRFSNLKSVHLTFAKDCAGPGKGFLQRHHIPEQVKFRVPILKSLFAGLNHEHHPALSVHSIALENLQNITPEALTSSTVSKFQTDFQAVRSRINSLSLSIATEYDDAAPEHTLDIPEAHTFFATELNQYWLEPMRHQLTHLKLYAREMYWGYYPRYDPPHFPKLRSLILGNLSFTHDKQLDWILSHADTLEELILDDCPIIVGAQMCGEPCGEDRYIIRKPRRGGTGRGRPYKESWLYEGRWHDYLNKLKEGLPKLGWFAFGAGDWSGGRIFAQAERLKSSMLPKRYAFFDAGTGPSPWLEDEGTGFNSWDDEPVKRPDCDEEDAQALRELLEVVRKRRS
ncbi:hypothetical protein H2203_001964 [Taxawa tesnikishii (nom. ined.)]|nr:hypothetical protein H2203_001964 [Dothideales sp. JES 119]